MSQKQCLALQEATVDLLLFSSFPKGEVSGTKGINIFADAQSFFSLIPESLLKNIRNSWKSILKEGGGEVDLGGCCLLLF